MKRSRRPLAERLDPTRLEAPGTEDAQDRILWRLVVVMVVSLCAAGLFALLLQS
jgi:fatty acid desaturase